MRFDLGPFALYGNVATANAGRGGFCPRRHVLDSILLNGAEASGVEIREAFTVEGLVLEGDTVVGIRGHQRGGGSVEERARIVIGADGIHSIVARQAKAPAYDSRSMIDCAYYSYFSDVDQDDIELFVRNGCAFGGAPTNDGLHMIMVNWPSSKFASVRTDIDGHVYRALESSPDFAARVREGKRVEKWYGTAGVPSYFRKPFGKGWALVGDAGYNRDPITAQGMSDAFVQARDLADAIDAAFPGRVNGIEESLARFEDSRNARARFMYDFTYTLAALELPPPPMQMLFGALRNNQEATNDFFSAITGATPLHEFMAPENLGAIIGAASAA
jgi:flavin-dependent dehydrogenase